MSNAVVVVVVGDQVKNLRADLTRILMVIPQTPPRTHQTNPVSAVAITSE